MNESDRKLVEYFAQMRKKDEQLLIPDFEVVTKRTRRKNRKYLVPLSISASVLLVISLYLVTSSRPDAQEKLEIVITISSIEQPNTDALLISEADIDSWIAPSAFLIADFNAWQDE